MEGLKFCNESTWYTVKCARRTGDRSKRPTVRGSNVWYLFQDITALCFAAV